MSYIQEVNLGKLDFRLLELFSAMIRLRSVTKSAIMLGLPQPTASRGLNRLRDVIGDELFIRTPHGMQPTAYAFAISDTVEQILGLSKSLEPVRHEFDPAQTRRTFVIAGSDVGQSLILPKLYGAMVHYPGITLKTVVVPGNDLSIALEEGAIDLAFGPYPDLLGGIKQQALYEEYYECFCMPEHLYARTPTANVFLASHHLLVLGSPVAHSHREVEVRLRDLLEPERIRVISENYLSALLALTDSDLLLTAPAKAVRPVAERLGLAALEPPIPLPQFQVKQYWHERNHNDSGHRWLRSTLREAMIERRQTHWAKPDSCVDGHVEQAVNLTD